MDILWVGDFDTHHYLLNHPQVQNRMNPRLHTLSELERRLWAGQEIPGVLQSEVRTWLEERRFALRTLRDFGFGKSGIEQMIKEEVHLFTEEIRKSEGEPSFSSLVCWPALTSGPSLKESCRPRIISMEFLFGLSSFDCI